MTYGKKAPFVRRFLLLFCMVFITFCMTACNSSAKAMEEAKEKGIESMQSGDYTSAVESFDEALSLSGGKVNEQIIDICYYKAAAQYAAGNLAEAIAVYDSIIVYDETDYRPYFLRGSVYLNEGETEKALADYDNAIACVPEDYDLPILIYQNLLASGMEESTKYLDDALDREGTSGADDLGRGRIYLAMGDNANAITALEAAVDKKEPEAKVYLAQAYASYGESEKASTILAEYVAEEDPSPEALVLLANMQLTDGDYESALAYYQKGLESVKDDATKQDLLRGEIAAYEYLGEFDAAKEKMDAYIALYPSDLEAVREQIFLQSR